MRIMHVITNMMASGGAEVMLMRLARVTRNQRPIVVSLMGVSERYRQLITEFDMDTRALNARSAAGMLESVWRLARMIRDERPDAVMCWLYHAMIVGQLAAFRTMRRVPVLWNVRQSLDDVTSMSRSTRLAVRGAQLLSHWPAGIVFNSARALELHRAFGYRNANCVVIPNGFDLAPPLPARPLTPTVLGIAGRLHPQKDYATFFTAAAQVARTHLGARFVAVGAGLENDNGAVRGMIEAAGLPFDAIELRGNTSNMDAFYREIDALVLSSRTEGFPNVVAEAMNFGKPVISTDVGDAAAVVGNAGFVVPPADAAALARAMRRMLDLRPSEYAALSTAAKVRIDNNYSLQHVSSLYGSFLDEAARSRAKPRGLLRAA